VRQDGVVSVSDPGGITVDVYWRAVLYLFVEKAEPLRLILFM
jgi:hypothetical protein